MPTGETVDPPPVRLLGAVTDETTTVLTDLSQPRPHHFAPCVNRDRAVGAWGSGCDPIIAKHHSLDRSVVGTPLADPGPQVVREALPAVGAANSAARNCCLLTSQR